MAINLNDYTREIECVYKDEHYTVRDNGAVLRHAFEGKRPRPTDNKWTFGKPNVTTAYLEIASARVHRIVATAFHGEPPTKEYVVDHIDTNKQNNRPENLRWLTRLENILLNPITAKRIALVCGSVEAFLNDPVYFRNKFQEPNLKWMQAVTVQEAQLSKERLLAWAKIDKPSSGKSLDEWLFKDNRNSQLFEEVSTLVISETPNAGQKDWKTPSAFPCCPQEHTDGPLYSYAGNLKIGEIFSRNKYSCSIISDYALSEDGNTLWVICKAGEANAIKPWSLAKVTYEDNLFIHTNLGSFFAQTGAAQQFVLAQGLEWTGDDSIDDFT